MPGIGLSFFDQAFLASSAAVVIADPTDIPNLYTWMEAETGVRDAAGNVIVVDGTDVNFWDDQGGAGMNLVAKSAGQRPTWEDGEWNGRAIIRFASTDIMLVAGAAQAQPQTLFFVARMATSSYNTSICTGSVLCQWFFERDTYGRLAVMVNGGADVPFGACYPGAGAPILACVIFDGASSKYAVNSSTLLALANPGTNTMGGLAIGGNIGGSGYTSMDFAELIWYDDAVSAENCSAMMQWLSARYAVALTGALPYGPGPTDDFESYADGNDLDSLAGGSYWDGDWVAR
jgi:hypothetical protein